MLHGSPSCAGRSETGEHRTAFQAPPPSFAHGLQASAWQQSWSQREHWLGIPNLALQLPVSTLVSVPGSKKLAPSSTEETSAEEVEDEATPDDVS